jgi:hypothetical protein
VVTAPTPAGPRTAIDRRFVYDGWNLVAEVDGDGELARSYVWGPDLSGSWQGAGGTGGLLLATQHRGTGAGASAVFHDANGNVVALADMVSREVKARYEYDVFGNVVSAVAVERRGIRCASAGGMRTRKRGCCITATGIWIRGLGGG